MILFGRISSTSPAQGYHGDGHAALPCEWVTSLVLAFRATAIAMVYLQDRKTRTEAFDVQEVCRRVWARILASTSAGAGGTVGFQENEIDGIALVPTEGEGRSSSFGTADRDVRRMGHMASRNLTELDLAAAEAEAKYHHKGQDETMGPTDSQVPYQLME